MLNALMFVCAFLSERRRLDDRGVTAIEYGLIAALIAVAIIAVLITVGGALNTIFGDVATALNNA